MVISMENITVNKEFHELHFDSIQALRGLAALFVVFQHVRFLNFGAFGVDIFFCISGFMIMFTTEKSTKYFFRKRLVRILPLYYLMTLGTYLSLLLFPSMFQQTRHDFSYLVKSLLLDVYKRQPPWYTTVPPLHCWQNVLPCGSSTLPQRSGYAHSHAA